MNQQIQNSDLELLEKIHQLSLLEQKIKSLVDDKLSRIQQPKNLDFITFVAAVTDRALKNSRGFRTLLESKNIQCLVTIFRAQIENIARFYGINLVQNREEEYFKTFLNPKKKIRHLEDNNGKKLWDKYLIEALNQKYSGILQFYNEFCNYAHLSVSHLIACCTMVPLQDNKHYEFGIVISAYDNYRLDEISYFKAIDQYFYIMNNILVIELDIYLKKWL